MILIRLLSFYLACFCVTHFVLAGESRKNEGPTCAKEEFLLLWQVISDIAGEKKADDIFEDWKEPEINVLKQEMQLSEESLLSHRGPFQSEKLVDSFGVPIMGKLVEGFSQAVSRSAAAKKSRIFVGKSDIQQNYFLGDYADGLVLRFVKHSQAQHGELLIIEQIIEANYGGKGFSSSRSKNLLVSMRHLKKALIFRQKHVKIAKGLKLWIG